jgi:hypothetical protein
MSSVSSVAKQVQTSTGELAAAKNRGYIGIQNLDGSNPIHIHFGTEDATALNGVKVGAGEFYELRLSNNNTAIQAIAITGAVNIVFLEANNL